MSSGFWDIKPKEPAKPSCDALLSTLRDLSTKWWKMYHWLVSKSTEAVNKGIHPLDIPALEEKELKFESDIEAPLLKVMEELKAFMGKKEIDEVFYAGR